MRCEGMTRHGGVMSFGRPYWTQCENKATTMLTVIQNGEEGTFPACDDCVKKVESWNIKVINSRPIIKNKMVKGIRKVKVLDKKLQELCHLAGWDDEDMAEVTLELIEGCPTKYLQDKYLKKKDEENE